MFQCTVFLIETKKTFEIQAKKDEIHAKRDEIHAKKTFLIQIHTYL